MEDKGRVEDLEVYRKLCHLHIEVSTLTHEWPSFERFELASQVRRSSNSSPSQLAEKHDDRHVRNKIEGINRARNEANETIHHLFIARVKQYISDDTYSSFRSRYKRCVRMLNGLERYFEQQLPPDQRRWPDGRQLTTTDEPPTSTSRPPITDHRLPTTDY